MYVLVKGTYCTAPREGHRLTSGLDNFCQRISAKCLILLFHFHDCLETTVPISSLFWPPFHRQNVARTWSVHRAESPMVSSRGNIHNHSLPIFLQSHLLSRPQPTHAYNPQSPRYHPPSTHRLPSPFCRVRSGAAPRAAQCADSWYHSRRPDTDGPLLRRLTAPV